MSEVEKRLELAGLNLPPAPLPGGMYTPVRPFGMRCAYLSGVACNLQGGETFEGKVGAELTLEQAEKAAEQCALNAGGSESEHWRFGQDSQCSKTVGICGQC